MDRRKATLGGAAVGVVAGVVGLVVLAAPAGAGPAPTLPATTPQALVQSVLTASAPSMSGTVAIDNNLGLPAVPGIPELANGNSQLRVWADGTGRTRVSIPSGTSEQTYVDDGKTLYSWDSSDRSVTESPVGKDKPGDRAGHRPSGMPMGGSSTPTDPASLAKQLVSALQNSSNISVDGTDTVAGQPAYDLVLTPKANQRTLLREVKIAIDANKHIPLQLTVLGDNSATPAVQVGFASVNYGPQQSSLFTFTPPAGATITKNTKPDTSKGQQDPSKDASKSAPKIVGSGWDTVAIITMPTGSTTTPSGTQDNGSGMPNWSNGPGGSKSSSSGSSGSNPLALAREFGTPVSGSWGSGWSIGTNIGTALITSDGRIAVGLVPQQVLTEALGSK